MNYVPLNSTNVSIASKSRKVPLPGYANKLSWNSQHHLCKSFYFKACREQMIFCCCFFFRDCAVIYGIDFVGDLFLGFLSVFVWLLTLELRWVFWSESWEWSQSFTAAVPRWWAAHPWVSQGCLHCTMQHDAAAFKVVWAELGLSLELRLETRLCGERGGLAAQTRRTQNCLDPFWSLRLQL